MNNNFYDFTFRADLPGESFPGQTITEMIGDNRVLVENHKGLSEYSCERILINLQKGQLCITGNDLCIACMTKQRLIIKGTISCISTLKGR